MEVQKELLEKSLKEEMQRITLICFFDTDHVMFLWTEGRSHNDGRLNQVEIPKLHMEKS